MGIRTLHASEDPLARIPDTAILYDSATGVPLPIEVFTDADDGTSAEDVAEQFLVDARAYFEIEDLYNIDRVSLKGYQEEWFQARREKTAAP